MMMKFFLSRKWLMAGSILFLSAACQPKAEPSQQQNSRREDYSRPSRMDDGCDDNSCKTCPAECPTKECEECPCPTECPTKECEECPCPKECPKSECKECPCPTDCPKQECPCPTNDCNSCAVEPEKKASGSVSQSSVILEKKTEDSVSSVKTQADSPSALKASS